MTGLAAIEQKKTADKALAQVKCQELCQVEMADGKDLNLGPCLSNKIINDWVCDVAHNPRETIDNKKENQCSAFSTGQAHHFVEVDGNCNLINTN